MSYVPILPSPMIYYPDGVSRPRPKDSKRFLAPDSSTYVWDDLLGVWVDINGEIWRPEHGLQVIGSEGRACQCGSAFLGSDKHSEWCALYAD